MKHSISRTTLVGLELTQDEANWLHSVMQNPLFNQTPDEESLGDREMRQKFFTATSIAANRNVTQVHTGSGDNIIGDKL